MALPDYIVLSAFQKKGFGHVLIEQTDKPEFDESKGDLYGTHLELGRHK